MEKINVHPHEIMAEFVDKYEKRMLPFLKKSDIKTLQSAIMNAYANYLYLNEHINLNECNFNAYLAYQEAVQELASTYKTALAVPEADAARLTKRSFQNIDRRVSELDIILSTDPKYSAYKARLEKSI